MVLAHNQELHRQAQRHWKETIPQDENHENNLSILTVQPRQPVGEYLLRSCNKDRKANPRRTDLV